MKEFLQSIYFNNSILDYLICVSIIIIGFIIIKIVKHVMQKRLKVLVSRTSSLIDDYLLDGVSKNIVPLLYLSVVYLSLQGLTLNASIVKGIKVVGLFLFIFFGVRFLIAIIVNFTNILWLRKEVDPNKQQAITGIQTVLKLVIWVAAFVIFLDNMGIKITAVVAGLGIGGIAVALAAQTVLGDLFSHFAIFFDRPFVIGDFIIVGDYMGVVEHIGIKTTRIRSLGGEQLVFSNTDLTNSRIKNYKRMEKRRVVFKLGVTYQTELKKLKEIPGIIENIIKNVSDSAFDRAHFLSFGDFSLVIEVVYYVLSGDYNKYMDIQQEINFKISEEFEKRKIQFAYPTQTLYINK
ncbi:MAG: mechanosensitive ion channel family protein [bacterium]